jgi:hypothetical protein
MDELKELADARQIAGEARRRWFHSPDLDLFVWLDDDDKPVGFQLCYDKNSREHALTWRDGRGYDHSFVDDGESGEAQYKSTPILRADGYFKRDRVKSLFVRAAKNLPPVLRQYVTDKLDGYTGRMQ